MVALEGVTRYGLREAVRSILKGGLNHAFFPSPPELRIQCDKAMEWPERQRERQIRAERMEQERREYAVDRKRSPEEIARVSALMAKFHASYDTEKTTADEAERAEIRDRYGLTDEAVSALPDQPLPSNFKRVA